MPRSARYARAGAPGVPRNAPRKNAAAASLTATRGSLRDALPAASSGTGSPKRSATSRTASGNDADCVFMTNVKTSPPSPQPKQW